MFGPKWLEWYVRSNLSRVGLLGLSGVWLLMNTIWFITWFIAWLIDETVIDELYDKKNFHLALDCW